MDNSLLKNKIAFSDLSTIKVKAKETSLKFKKFATKTNIIPLSICLSLIVIFSICIIVKNIQIKNIINQTETHKVNQTFLDYDNKKKVNMILTEKSLRKGLTEQLQDISNQVNLIQKKVSSLKAQNSELRAQKEKNTEIVLSLDDRISKQNFHHREYEKTFLQLQLKNELLKNELSKEKKPN